MLDKPDFVASYEIGDYVYFFYRSIFVDLRQIMDIIIDFHILKREVKFFSGRKLIG